MTKKKSKKIIFYAGAMIFLLPLKKAVIFLEQLFVLLFNDIL
jgi:hypothetical protein